MVTKVVRCPEFRGFILVWKERSKAFLLLAVHLRRKDFIWGHREDVPRLDGAVKICSLMKTHQLDNVFAATDAIRTEHER